MQSAVKAPKISVVNSQNTKKSWSRFDLVVAVNGSDTPCNNYVQKQAIIQPKKGKVVQHKPKVQR